MSTYTPYIYIQCPCTDTSTPTRKVGDPTPRDANEDSEDDDERTFDPRAPRANYSLYPLEHLLYCEDCHQIRCPRCVLDEIVTWYCPNCLFEVPSSTVKSEGNRCTRSCFQCPICISPLTVSSVEATTEDAAAIDQAALDKPYVLHCGYCAWSSSEIGVRFEKANGIYAQLAKIRNGGTPVITPRQRRKDREGRRRDIASPSHISEDDGQDSEKLVPLDPSETLDADSQFSNLLAFYQSQLAESAPNNALGLGGGDYGYGSPNTLSRIMGIYAGGSFQDKLTKNKASVMREAKDALEGLQLTQQAEDETITRMRFEGWYSTTTSAQRREQPNYQARFLDDLRPTAYVLRTKRSKRCRTCRHILSKPEAKVANLRFRIRLVALNYIPSITIKPLPSSTSSSSTPLSSGGRLTPLQPVQFVLTFKNSLFESVRVTLATPVRTPGRFGSKVTILCPQFEIDANTDVWDEALREGAAGNRNSTSGGAGGIGVEKRRTKAEASEGQHQAEAGKVWERGRNWVSVVVEVVPASLRLDAPEFMLSEELKKDGGPLREDEDICEIPVFVRVEWEAEPAHEEAGGAVVGSSKEKEVKEKRELAYWCVLGVGRISRE